MAGRRLYPKGQVSPVKEINTPGKVSSQPRGADIPKAEVEMRTLRWGAAHRAPMCGFLLPSSDIQEY